MCVSKMSNSILSLPPSALPGLTQNTAVATEIQQAQQSSSTPIIFHAFFQHTTTTTTTQL
jgi:hypothetical protein